MPVLRYVVGAGVSQLSARGGAAALRLLTPGPDARLTDGGRVVFTWTSVSGAASYELEIQTRDRVKVLSAVLDADTPRYEAPPWLGTRSDGKLLRWRVMAADTSGSILQQTGWRPLAR
jgi:hypothetical protein